MKRKLLAFLVCAVLLAACIPSVLASETRPMVVDNASLFSQEEHDVLEAYALTLRQEYEMDIVILTVDTMNREHPQNYADDYYDSHGYGYDADGSGMIFLLSLEERDLYISTCGDAIYALTDYGIDATTLEVLPYFSEGDYYRGFYTWLDILEPYLEAYRNGTPIDSEADYSDGYYHGDREETVYYETDSSPSLLLALIIGLAAASVTILIMRFTMNTKRPQRSAGSYLISGSYQLRTQRDIFLYSNVTKTARPKDNGGSGGGSSVHRSSSGRRHGGGGRKF